MARHEPCKFLAQVGELAKALGLDDFPAEPRGVDAFTPLIERAFAEGAVILVKWDGQRTTDARPLPYTAVISGPPLGTDCLRADAASLESALARVLVRYGEARWGFRSES